MFDEPDTKKLHLPRETAEEKSATEKAAVGCGCSSFIVGGILAKFIFELLGSNVFSFLSYKFLWIISLIFALYGIYWFIKLSKTDYKKKEIDEIESQVISVGIGDTPEIGDPEAIRKQKERDRRKAKYRRDSEQAAKDIVETLRKIELNDSLCKKIESFEGYGDLKSKYPFEALGCPGIGFLALNDAFNCIEHLGHKFEMNNENYPVYCLLFLLKDAGHLLQVSESARDLILSKTYIQSAIDISHAISAKTEDGNDAPELFGLELFKEFEPEQGNIYATQLYRMCKLIAGADSNTTNEETQWLNKMMKLSDPETSKSQSIDDSIEEAMGRLDELIGLQSVKEEVRRLANFIKVQQMREARGLKTTQLTLHCVFTGNPGTGKTTVARIMADIYRSLGVLKKGHLVETDRSGLVAEYVGQTAVKTNKIIDSALDGVLFIDEAYSLATGGAQDYGNEAISTLLKRMEDSRDRLIVILAGYGDEMQTFIDANPGLQSRFSRTINFPDYSAEDLEKIFRLNLDKFKYVMTPEAEVALKRLLEREVAAKDKNFGNARHVRNLFERTLENQAMRLAGCSNPDIRTLSTIEAADLGFAGE